MECFIFNVQFGGERVKPCLRSSDPSSKLSDVSIAARPMDQNSPKCDLSVVYGALDSFQTPSFRNIGSDHNETVLWTASRLCPLLSAVKPNMVSPNGDIELGVYRISRELE